MIIFIVFALLSYILTIVWVPLVTRTNVVVEAVIVQVQYYGVYSILDWAAFVLYVLKTSMPKFSLLPTQAASWFIDMVTHSNDGVHTLFIPGIFIVVVLAYPANLLRLLLATVFLGSFLVKPILMDPLSLLWRRVVESDRPIFTLVFGGIAGFATAVNELMKHV